MREILDNALRILPQPWRSLAIPATVFLMVVALGLVVRRIALARLRKWARASPTRVDESLIETLHGPSLMWVMIFGIYAATDISELPANATLWAERALQVLWIVSLTIAISRLAGRAVRIYGTKNEGAVPTGSLTEILASLVVSMIGALTLMRILGIDITAILTALGVGGLAVALALQDTLSNFFAGFYVSVAGQIRVGDLVQLDSGQQGYVMDIGWRSTTLRQGVNNLIVIPNNKIAQSIVTNYYLPERRLIFTMTVSVSYEADPELVERTLFDTVKTADVAGLLKNSPPTILLSNFSERGQEFTVVCNVADFESQGRVGHELRKRILKRFRDSGIQFAVRQVELKPPQ
jgi:small-conductance mechanosensitive channel